MLYGLLASVLFLLPPVLYWWWSYYSMNQALERLSQRWGWAPAKWVDHPPKTGTLTGTVLWVGEEGREVALDALFERRRIAMEVRCGDLVLFPRHRGRVGRTLLSGVTRPVHGCLTLFVMGMSFCAFLPFLLTPPLDGRMQTWSFVWMALPFSLLPLASGFLWRTFRGSFPPKLDDHSVLTGDEAFDQRYCVKGDEDFVLACLDAETRRRLLALPEYAEPLLEEGTLTVFLPRGFRLGMDERIWEGVAPLLEHLAEHPILPSRSGPPRHLLENVKGDPVLGVRQRSLRWLHAKYPETPEAQEALEYALGGEVEELKALAKTYLRGDEESALGGQLSVALLPEKQGQLSVSQGEAGQLSVAAKEDASAPEDEGAGPRDAGGS